MSTIMRKMIMVERCERMYRAQKLNYDLPGFYHSYILAVCKNPGMSQEKLARYLCFNKSSVTRHLSNLEKNGYVERKTSPKDKRELLVFPTGKMEEIYPEVLEVTKQWDELIAKSVTDDEMNIFHQILDKIAERSSKIVYSEETQE